jgi:acyl carrier protein
MQELTPRLVTILQKYMRDPTARVVGATTFSDLEIDLLDLPMILLDVEDDFDVQIPYDDETEAFATVNALVVCVASHLEAKALQPYPRSSVPRSTRSWMSTGA